MNPISAKKLPEFMDRFDHFKDGEIRSIEVISPYVIKMVIAGQDRAREFDWVTVEFEFINVSAVRLVDENRLHLIDMSEGVSLYHREGIFSFGTGDCYNIASIQSSTAYIMSSQVKYQESSF